MEENHAKPKYWLMKSEPDVYSISHLEKDKTTWWEGVRNYQARNFMVRDMKIGDLVFFYHSNAKPSGIAGVAEVCAEAAADLSQFNSKSDYYDSKSTAEKPIWFCTQIKFKKKFNSLISLESLKIIPELKSMLLLQKGQRLSVQPLTREHFNFVIKNFDLNLKPREGLSPEL